MRGSLRFLPIGAALVVVALLVAYRAKRPAPVGARPSAAPDYPPRSLPTFPDPNAPGTSARVFLDPTEFDGGVFQAAARYTYD